MTTTYTVQIQVSIRPEGSYKFSDLTQTSSDLNGLYLDQILEASPAIGILASAMTVSVVRRSVEKESDSKIEEEIDEED
jgi:hypothetical protein